MGAAAATVSEASPFLVTALPPRSACADLMGCLPCFGGGAKLDSSLTFSNTPSNAAGDHSIPERRRVHFGIFFPADLGLPPVHMFFDREKDATKILEGACGHAGLKMERGRLAGSPEKLNLFTSDG